MGAFGTRNDLVVPGEFLQGIVRSYRQALRNWVSTGVRGGEMSFEHVCPSGWVGARFPPPPFSQKENRPVGRSPSVWRMAL